MTDFEKAKLDPSSFYKRPRDILHDETLSRDQKIDLLRRWGYDERELAVAEDENMQSPGHGNGNKLAEILETLLELGYSVEDDGPPTKQG